ncbi:hypothetical protein PG994_013144 [Apiospora phragmitis]|uniref:2EXR domain-containing protein n=1 Tax=Apiospora phragmitis TaxID=2905665 RepID=A0ABR1T7T9_9PEZI
MAFDSFSRLPCELRIKIIEETLRNETQHRIIVLSAFSRGKFRIHPFADLVSPLLSVNYECRHVARRFFTCKLAVYEVPLSHPDIEWCEAQFGRMIKMNFPLEEYSKSRGTLYLNLGRDIITTGTKPAPWHPKDVWEHSPRRLITEMLGQADCLMVRRFLRISADPGPSPMSMSEAHANAYWQARLFPRLAERLEMLYADDVVGLAKYEFLRDRAVNRDRLLNWPDYEIRRWSSEMAGSEADGAYFPGDKLVQPGLWDRIRYGLWMAFVVAREEYEEYLRLWSRVRMYSLGG